MRRMNFLTPTPHKKARSRRAPQKQRVTSGWLRHEEDSDDNDVDLLNSLKKTRRGRAA